MGKFSEPGEYVEFIKIFSLVSLVFLAFSACVSQPFSSYCAQEGGPDYRGIPIAFVVLLFLCVLGFFVGVEGFGLSVSGGGVFFVIAAGWCLADQRGCAAYVGDIADVIVELLQQYQQNHVLP